MITGSVLADLLIAVGLMIFGILAIIGFSVRVISYKFGLRRREGKGIFGKLFGEIYRLKEEKEV